MSNGLHSVKSQEFVSTLGVKFSSEEIGATSVHIRSSDGINSLSIAGLLSGRSCAEIEGDAVLLGESFPTSDEEEMDGLRTAEQIFAPQAIDLKAAITSSVSQERRNSSSGVMCSRPLPSASCASLPVSATVPTSILLVEENFSLCTYEDDEDAGKGATKLLRSYFALMNRSLTGYKSWGRGFFGPEGGTQTSHTEFTTSFPYNRESEEKVMSSVSLPSLTHQR